MRIHRVVFVLAAASGLAGCFGDRSVSCEDPGSYASSSSAPPLRVPDDLSVPDESQALQIPSGEPLAVPSDDEPSPCLERPPDFFAEDEDRSDS